MTDQPGDRAEGAPEDVGATQLSVLPTPRPERTGVPAVDAALDRLDRLDGANRGDEGGADDADHADDAAAAHLDDHVAAFEEVHGRLQEALGSTDAE